MATGLRKQEWIERRVAGWKDVSGRAVAGVTAYLLVSGLAIYALSFSVFNQHALVLHTAVGVVYLVPLAIYLVRHLRIYWSFPFTHIKFSGYALALMACVCSFSGVVLTMESVAGSYITPIWRTTHILTTFGVLIFLPAHLIPLWARARAKVRVIQEQPTVVAQRGYARVTVFSTLGLLTVTALMTVTIRPVEMTDTFPADYDESPYEGAGPFSPSLAKTSSGGALDPRHLSGSESCGTSGCHEEIYKEWLPSAHRYASMDVGFQAIQNVMATQNGAVSTRYCGGCHDPISLFSGTKNIGVDELSSLSGYQEGISCLACHAVAETDISGNANYVMNPPERYVWEMREGRLAKFLSDFTIRAYPDQHVESLSRTMFKTPEFCAACHKQFIDKEVNKVGWVQLQNQFDNWKASRWYDEDSPERTVECRECHMPLVASNDPAAGDEADANRSADDGMHRSHRFLGANQYIPALMELEGGQEHVELVNQWLQGDFEIPEIDFKWTDGPAVPIELAVPASFTQGEELSVSVHIINNKVGHDFPTGPLDIIQAWVELEVTDATGHVVFHTGKRDERNFIEPGTFMFKAEPVDRYGNLIDRHNLWEMVGVRFKRSLFPGSEEVATFAFECSGSAGTNEVASLDEDFALALPEQLAGPLTVRAQLNYRKFDQYLLNFTFGEEANLTAPVTVMSTAEAIIPVLGDAREGL